MPSVRGAVILSVASQYSVKMVNLVTMLVLARLLTPAEIGVFAIASGVIMLATALRQLGVTQYIIREVDITSGKIRAATGVMMVTSWSLGIVVAIAAPAISRFYGEQDIRDLLWVSSLAFALAPFASVPYAILTRELQFSALFKIRLVACLANAVAAVVLVWVGLSYMGLALASIISVVPQLAVILVYAPKSMPWFPSLRGAKEILQFCVFSVGGTSLAQLSPGLPDMILGRTGLWLM